MSVALKKIEGIEDAKVSLNEGRADLELKRGNRATLDQIRDAIRRNGFTPKGADIAVAGTLVLSEQRLALHVSGSDVVYLLWDAPSAPGKVAELGDAALGRKVTQVVVEGHVPEQPPKSVAPHSVLQVTAYRVVDPGGSLR